MKENKKKSIENDSNFESTNNVIYLENKKIIIKKFWDNENNDCANAKALALFQEENMHLDIIFTRETGNKCRIIDYVKKYELKPPFTLLGDFLSYGTLRYHKNSSKYSYIFIAKKFVVVSQEGRLLRLEEMPDVVDENIIKFKEKYSKNIEELPRDDFRVNSNLLKMFMSDDVAAVEYFRIFYHENLDKLKDKLKEKIFLQDMSLDNIATKLIEDYPGF